MDSNQFARLLCALVQIVGFIIFLLSDELSSVVGALVGFSAIIMCILSWNPRSTLNPLYALAAFCGVLLLVSSFVTVA